MRHNRVMLTIACVLSLLLHAAVAWSIHDLPLVRSGWDQAQAPERLFKVRRIDLPPVRTPDAGQDAADTSPSIALDLSEMSQALLSGGAEPDRPVGNAPQPTLAATQAQREEQLGTAPQVNLPKVAAHGKLIKQFIGELPLEVPFVQTPELTGDGGGGDDSVGEGSAEARQILAEQGLAPTAISRPRDIAPPKMTTFAPTQRPRDDFFIKMPPIDLRTVTLLKATQLKVPQYLDDDFDYDLSVFKPRRWGGKSDKGGDYFRVDITPRRSLRKLHTMPKDVVFMIDVSGSVSQQWVDAAVKGVSDSLISLNEGDRFNVVFFNEQARFFGADAIVAASNESRGAARQFLGAAQSGGYTDVNRALSRLLVRDLDADRVYDLILISDGRSTRGVKDTRELINLITRDNDMIASIYCVGVGNRQHHEVLNYLAYRNKGFCIFAKSSDQTASTIRNLLSRLRYPIIKDVSVTVSGLAEGDVFPRQLPNIHQGETFRIFGRFERLEIFTMQINGASDSADVAFKFKRNLGRATAGPEQIAHDWAFAKLHHLYSEQIRRGADKRLAREIKWLQERYKLKAVD